MTLFRDLTPEEFEDQHVEDLLAMHRGISFELFEQINDNAPVDTGRLRGSVNLSLDGYDIIQNIPDPTGEISKARMFENVMRADLNDTIYGTVGEEYAVYVDQGTDRMPPTGFFSDPLSNIGAFVQRAEDNIDEYRDEL